MMLCNRAQSTPRLQNPAPKPLTTYTIRFGASKLSPQYGLRLELAGILLVKTIQPIHAL